MTTASYSHARDNLAELWDQVEDTREEVVLQRRGHEDVALVPAAELRSLQETAHLLRSPANAVRLLGALARSRDDQRVATYASTDDLARELGL